jgi:heat shock protein HslJ
VIAVAACTTPAPTSRSAAPPADRVPTPVDSPVLKETSWRLEDLGGAAAIAGVQATLEFPGEGRVAGRGSCNRFFGTVEIAGETIRFGPLAATRMACVDPAANDQEKRYLEALQDAERFAFDGPALLIYSRNNDRPLRFSRK